MTSDKALLPTYYKHVFYTIPIVEGWWDIRVK